MNITLIFSSKISTNWRFGKTATLARLSKASASSSGLDVGSPSFRDVMGWAAMAFMYALVYL
jgi:hypothetical protein